MTNDLALRPTNIITTMDDAERAAKSMQTSGYFKDVTSQAQAIVKILAGAEMGFGPFASMNGVHIIQGRPSLGANLIASAIKRSGRYNFRLHQGHPNDKECAVDFFERMGDKWENIGTSAFTMEDAKKAGLTNKEVWAKFPRNMLFSRALSNGARWFCPDVFNGSTVYTPEELGAQTDEEGDVISGSFEPEPQASIASPAPTNGAPAQSPEPPTQDAPAYTGPLAKIGHGKFPQDWAKTFATFSRCNQFELGGILNKLALPQATPIAEVVTRVNNYIDEKEEQQDDAARVELEQGE